MIEILLWVVELGRIDIVYEISVLSRYLVQPWTGQFVQALHILRNLGINKDRCFVFKPAIYELSDCLTINSKIKLMKKMYPDAIKYLPPNATPPRGSLIQNHASLTICYYNLL